MESLIAKRIVKIMSVIDPADSNGFSDEDEIVVHELVEVEGTGM